MVTKNLENFKLSMEWPKSVSEHTWAWAAPRKSREREMEKPVDDCKCHG